MAKMEPKWASQQFVAVNPKAEAGGNFNIEQGRVHIVADGQGVVTGTLPVAANGLNVYVKALIADLDTDTLLIAPQGGSDIDGVAGNYTVTNENQTLHLVSDGSDWFIL